MVYQIEIENPDVRALLENLAKLNLIRIQEIKPSKEAFLDLVGQLRKKGGDELTETEIADEVESVRTARYERKTQNHH